MKHVNIKIAGRVQGVFFRASTKEQADNLGIQGFVRNENDGSVYVEAEGDEDSLRKFVAWCERGPDRAKVQSCLVSEDVIKNFNGFRIERS